MSAYSVVKQFEARVAKHFGLKYGIAVDCCTSAIFLSLMYRRATRVWGNCDIDFALIPNRTYISVPFAVIQVGLHVRFNDFQWSYAYSIDPWDVIDAAKMWKGAADVTPQMPDGLWCVSFHIKKPLPIGRGGMILTNDAKAVKWLRKARYDGRTEGVALADDKITTHGWHRYMMPEQAARGMALMDIYPGGVDIPREEYPDLSQMPVFKGL